MKHLSTLLILLSINIGLMAQSMGVNMSAGATPNTMLDVNGGVSFREGTALACVNGINNDIVLANYSFYRITGPTAAFSITGFSNGTDGRVLTVINASGQSLTLSHLTSSTSANQVNTGGSPVVLPANGVATFIYNANLTKWIVSGTMGTAPSFTSITNGSLSDSMVVVNNGVPLRVRPNDYIETYAWGIDGNVGTVDGTHFIGTTDDIPLSIKVNNQKAGRIDHLKSNVFLGYLSGNSMTTGGANTAIGQNALRNVTTNGYNVAVGTDAMLNATGAYNIAIGPGALQSGISDANIAIGYGALQSTTTGSGNIAIGNLAGSSTTTGASNTGVGYGSLINTTTGSDNTAFGNSTLLSNSTGNLNTTVGKWAMYSNTIGQNNTSLGAFSLHSNATGSDNVALGNNALYNVNGSRNVAVGSYAATRLSTGTDNLLLGNESGNYITTGSRNVILGYQGSNNLTTGSNNIAIGYIAQVPTATASNQLSIGNWIYGINGNIGLGLTAPSVKLQQDGGNATATYHKFTAGTTTGQTTTDGFDVGIDASGNAYLDQNENAAMYFYTNNAEQMQISAAGNVLIGAATPAEVTGVAVVNQSANDLKDDVIITTYNGTTTPAFVIFKARGTAAAPTILTNNEVIGGFNANGYNGTGFTSLTAMSTVTASDFTTSFGADIAFKTSRSGTSTERMRIMSTGNVGIGVAAPSHILQINGQGRATNSAWATTSDRRLKDIDGTFEYGLKELLKINTVRFHYKKDNVLQLPTDKAFQGIIAQDLQKIIPEAVTKMSDGYLTVNTDPVFWTMLNAIKELDAKVEALTKENTALKAKVSDVETLKAEIEKIKKAIGIETSAKR